MDKQNKTPESQVKASRKWEKENRAQATKNNYRRTARLFIRKHAEKEDLDELQELIDQRKEEIKRNKMSTTKNVTMGANELVEAYIKHSFPEGYINKLFHGVYTGTLDDGAKVVVSNVPMSDNVIEVDLNLGNEKIVEHYYMKDNGFYQVDNFKKED